MIGGLRLAVALAVVGTALGLSACGGNGDSTATTDSDSTVATQPSPEDLRELTQAPQSGPASHPSQRSSSPESQTSETEGERDRAPRERKGDRERKEYELERYGPPSKRSVSFKGAEGPLKHLPEYGEEASDAKREKAQSVLAPYLAAVGAKNWTEACRYVSPYFVEDALAQIAGVKFTDPELKDKYAGSKSCEKALEFANYFREATTKGAKGPQFQDFDTVRIASLRVEPLDEETHKIVEENTGGKRTNLEANAFVLLHGSEGKDYWLTMNLEGGEWKPASLAPSWLY